MYARIPEPALSKNQKINAGEATRSMAQQNKINDAMLLFIEEVVKGGKELEKKTSE